MSYMDQYKLWLLKSDELTISELSGLKDEKEIEDRFYRTLEFGTAGLRGIMAAGTNRMNRYVIGQATQALANYIISQKGAEKGIVIAYDCRINSKEFATYCAEIMAANDIKTYLFEDLRPTPELSFAIRHLGAISGVNITASHNPKEYNGYKVFWEKGSQILSNIGNELLEEIKNVDIFKDVKHTDLKSAIEKGTIEIIGKEIDDLFVENIKNLAIHDDIDRDIKIIYTPLNGTGLKPITRILSERGFKNVTVVKEQKEPDGNFPSTPYPNPEDHKVFKIPLEYAKREDADLIMATDPDADRIGIMIKDKNNEFIALNGNQTGVLLVNYIVNEKKKKGQLKGNEILIKTIVTGDMAKDIAASYGVKTFETLTGFKYICGLYNDLEEEGKYEYLFGFEESIGYCPETFTRDKNAVSTAVMIAEMCAYYKKNNKTLYEILYELYDKYGHYREKQVSIEYKGIEGVKIKDRVMKMWRLNYHDKIIGIKVKDVLDYEKHVEDHIEPSNVLKFILDDKSWYAVRPSGTEPKLKIYIYVVDDTEEKALKKLDAFEKEIREALLKFEKE